MDVKNKTSLKIPQRISQTILKKYPDLTSTELRICALLSFNLTSKAVAEMTGRSVRTIEFTRNNIRKKMNLQRDEKLVNHLILITDKD